MCIKTNMLALLQFNHPASHLLREIPRLPFKPHENARMDSMIFIGGSRWPGSA